MGGTETEDGVDNTNWYRSRRRRVEEIVKAYLSFSSRKGQGVKAGQTNMEKDAGLSDGKT